MPGRALSSAADRVRVGPVLDHVTVTAATANDLVLLAVDGIDEVAPALADKGVGAEVPQEAVLAAIPDQDIRPVGALEALVVAADPIRIAAATRTSGAAQLNPQISVRAPVRDGVVPGPAVVGMPLAGRYGGYEQVVAGPAGELIGTGVGVEDIATGVSA